MIPLSGPRRRGLALAAAAVLELSQAIAAPAALNPSVSVRLVMNTTNASGAASIRLAKDPRDNQLYYLKMNGDVWRVNLLSGAGSTASRVYSAADHGLSSGVEGLAIGPDGTIYLLGNTTTNGGSANWVRIVKGIPSGAGRSWSLLAQTQPYALSKTAFDHLYNAIVVDPAGDSLYVNCGSRTDHGEVEDAGGLYPNLREAPLTAKILRLPTAATGLVLTNDLAILKAAGYVFAEGTRNAFDLEFAPNGELFATDNGPDRDMSDELNWIRAGGHYGFPWRMGGTANPQQFSGYNPATDRLLDPRFVAVQSGKYHDDPTFPAAPGGFLEPVLNVGPDANRYRDPSTGAVLIATNGQAVSTFTAHRSPLGLVFDSGAMAPPFAGHAFVLGWTQGDATGDTVAGPFRDPGQDMCDLALTKVGGTNYQTTTTRIVGGFANPIDAEIVGNQIYVLEYGGQMGLWEIRFPPAIGVTAAGVTPAGAFTFAVSEPPGWTNTISASDDLVHWVVVTNLAAPLGRFQFTGPAATNAGRRYYRVSAQ